MQDFIIQGGNARGLPVFIDWFISKSGCVKSLRSIEQVAMAMGQQRPTIARFVHGAGGKDVLQIRKRIVPIAAPYCDVKLAT